MRCLDHEREAEVRSMLREAGRLPVSPFVLAVRLSLQTAVYRHREASTVELAGSAQDVERHIESLIVRAQEDALACHAASTLREVEIGRVHVAEEDEAALVMRAGEATTW